MGNRATRSADKNKRRVTHNSDGTDGNVNVKSSTVTSPGAREQQVSGQTDVNGAKQLQVNIYRSYSQLGNGTSRRAKPAEPTPDFKVYRRSARPHITAANRSMSLPRSFGRTQRLGDQLDVATMPRRKTDDTRPIARSSSRASNISSTLKVSASDFPASDFVRRRVQLFQKSFVSTVTRLLSSLPLDVRLSSLALAVSAVTHESRYVRVTLADFLQMTTKTESEDRVTHLSSDFLDQCAAGQTDFVPCVPDALFPGITHARNDKVCDESLLTSLCNDVMTLVAAEAGGEVARMFEYQLSLLLGAVNAASVSLVADHCAQRAVDYAVNVCHVVDRNTLMQGAVRGRPPKSPALYVSAVVGQRELKWNVFEIVTRPGLRRDVMLRDAMTDLGVSPWQYMTSSHCEPMLYGYRGEMLDFDFVSGVYRVNSHDEASFPDEMTHRYDDFHRSYTPYYRLVGAPAMSRYLVAAAGKMRLQQYLAQLSDDARYTTGTAMPVYRPLELVEMKLPRADVDIGPVDAPRQLLAALKPSASSSTGGGGRDVRRAKSCITAAGGGGGGVSSNITDDPPVFSNNNVLAVSHVQQTGV